MIDRNRDYHKGDRLVGAACPADARPPRNRSSIAKGDFLVGGGCPGAFVAKRAPLPPDLAQFEGAADVADKLAAFDHDTRAGITEIARRLEFVRKQLDSCRKPRK